MRTPRTSGLRPPRHRARRCHPLAPLTLCVCTVVLPACVDSNSRTTLGDGVVLEAFTAPDFPDPRGGATRPDDPPSLVGLDRTNWQLREFLVPVDGTHHRPHYVTWVDETDVTARQRNEYPTLLSSLHLDGNQAGEEAGEQQWAEAFWAPLQGFGEMLLIPIKLIMVPQGRVHVSPADDYQRRPSNRLRLAAPLLHQQEEPLRQQPAPVEDEREPGT